MNLSMLLWSEFSFYWAWWLCFAAIAFCGSRWIGWPGVALAALLIAALVVIIEFHSVIQDMRNYPNSGRDMDGPFLFGVLFRVGFYNVTMIPIYFIGLKMRFRRSSPAKS